MKKVKGLQTFLRGFFLLQWGVGWEGIILTIQPYCNAKNNNLQIFNIDSSKLVWFMYRKHEIKKKKDIAAMTTAKIEVVG